MIVSIVGKGQWHLYADAAVCRRGSNWPNLVENALPFYAGREGKPPLSRDCRE